jgi:hypothetical protein
MRKYAQIQLALKLRVYSDQKRLNRVVALLKQRPDLLLCSGVKWRSLVSRVSSWSSDSGE